MNKKTAFWSFESASMVTVDDLLEYYLSGDEWTEKSFREYLLSAMHQNGGPLYTLDEAKAEYMKRAQYVVDEYKEELGYSCTECVSIAAMTMWEDWYHHDFDNAMEKVYLIEKEIAKQLP